MNLSASNDEETNYLAIFKVFCDESGKLGDSRVVIFAGCIFREDEVSGFSRKWNELLKDAGISYLHTNEAVRLQGEFRTWRNRASDRDDLLEALCKLLHDRCALNLVFTMDVGTFKGLDQRDQELLKNPIYAAFDGLMKSITADAIRRNSPGDRFHLVYDLCDEYSVQCLKLFDRMRITQSVIKQFFPSLTFADDREFPALQAADMIAYCGKEEFLNGEGRCTGIVGQLLEISRSRGSIPKTAVFMKGRQLGEAIVE